MRGAGSAYSSAYSSACSSAYPAARPWTPLALTLGLHLLLVLAWLAGARGGVERERANQPPRASVLVLLQPPSVPRAEPEPAAARPSPRPARPPAPGIPLSTPSVTAADATPAPPVSASASEAAANTTVQADPAPAALPGDLLATSKAMAGRVDRELRKGASPITAEPERKWERFAEAFAAARKGGSSTVTLDSYTGPDGVVVYRKTVGGRLSCYRSGSVGGLVTGFGAADGHGAGNTPCPTGVSWTRH